MYFAIARVNRKREKLIIKGKLEQIRQRLLIIAMRKLWRKKRLKFAVIRNQVKKVTPSKLALLMDLNQRIGVKSGSRERTESMAEDFPELIPSRSRSRSTVNVA